MNDLVLNEKDRVLILGATGFIGSRLIPELVTRNIRLRLLVRDPSKARGLLGEGADIEVRKGDIFEERSLRDALEGIHTAYYFVHSLGGKTLTVNLEFVKKDRKGAETFISVANDVGLKRVIYLGGLGEMGEGLSEHLRSRAEVGKILSSGNPAATVLRAAVIIGASGASFEMLRYLVERLPVMICPRWIDTRIQPIALQDVLAYLVGCLLNPQTAGQTFDIGGPEILSYRKMMHQYAEARGLTERFVITVPVLTPLLSAYWVDLVTPIPSGIAHALIEGLKNEVVCKDNRIDEFVPIKKTPFKEAVKIAFSEEKEGPGITGF